MSDLEQFQVMLIGAGIKFENPLDDRTGCVTVKVVGGYAHFYTLFTFTPIGQLKSVEAASTISSAAHEQRQAVAEQQQAMNEWLDRFEAIVERIPRPPQHVGGPR